MTQTIDARCPECGAEYKLTPEQLNIAQGQVRCGSCMTIFQAIPPVIPDAEPTEAESESELETRSEFARDHDEDLVIIDSDDEMLDSKRDQQSSINLSGEGNFFDEEEEFTKLKEEVVDESWAEDLMDETALNAQQEAEEEKAADTDLDEFADVIKLNKVDHSDMGFDESDKSGILNRITPEPLELKVSRDNTLWVNIGLSALAIVLVLGVFYQAMAFQLDTLARKPEWRANYQTFCGLFGCELPEQYSISDLSASHTHQKGHDLYNNALLFETVITNHARFKQPFPNLEVYYTNLQNKVVAARKFKPEEYLRGQAADSAMMPVRQPVHIALELEDPGKKASGYQLRLSY